MARESKSRAIPMSSREMVFMVKILDEKDYDCKLSKYPKPNIRKDHILQTVVAVLQRKCGVTRTKYQIRKRWSDLKNKESTQLENIRRLIAHKRIRKNFRKLQNKREPGASAESNKSQQSEEATFTSGVSGSATGIYRVFRMEKDKMEMTRKFFGLALEIIYLLTGEDFVVMKESGELISRRVNHVVSDSSNESLGAASGSKLLESPQEIKSDKKILKLTSKIIHLLTGEVRRFVGHVDGGNENMAEYSQPAPSQDECDNRNPLERYLRPEHFRDSAEEEDDTMEQDDHEDNVISIKVEDEEGPYVRGEEPSEEEEYSPEISTDGPSNRSTLERCPLPLFSRDSTTQQSPHKFQAENPDGMKVVIVPQTQDGEIKKIQTEVSSDHEGKNDFSPPENVGSHHSRIPPDWPSNQLVSLEGNIYICYECGKCVVYDTNLQQADAGLSSPLCCDCDKATPLKPFRCAKCGKTFSSKVVYMAHQSVHNGGQSFPCGECGMTFSNKSILETHQSIHTGDRPFSCSECGKCFALKANLVKHLKVHKGEKPFSCQECSKSFSMKSNLVKHQRVHTGEKPFECAHCGRTFGMKSNLVKHQRIHTGEKPFKCLECGKCFASRSNLTTHEKIHTGEKPFTCTFCSKGFITSSDLSRHQKTHTGERPFTCSDCGKSFISKFILTTHQKSHTGDEPALASELVPEHLDSC